MGKLILKRLVTMIPLLIIMSFVTFVFLSLSPGNFVSSMRLNPSYSEETIRMIEKQYHLDQNLMVRYVLWLRDIIRLDFGYSFTFKRRVGDIIFSRAFYTLLLSFSSFLFTWLLAVPLGIICAVYKDRLWDKIISFSAFATLSMPSFFLALLLLYAATATGILPAGGVTSSDFDSLPLWGKVLDHLRHIIIPMLVIGISSMAGIIRITRGNVIEIMSKEYVTAARARGLSGFSIFYVHILKNALNPLITIFGYYISSLLSGAALTEIICSWPGLGSIMLQAVRSQDINLVMASMVIGGVMLIAGNLVADILLAMNDKRIMMQSA